MRARPSSAIVGGIVLAVLSPVLAACTTESDEAEPRSTARVLHSRQLHDYFSALSDLRPAHRRRALGLTAPGSAAHKYVTFQVALAEARRDDGVKAPRTRVVRASTGYDICAPGPGRHECSQFRNAIVRDGKVVDFDVDGDDIADNLSVGSGRPEELDAGGSVEFLSSYLQPSTGAYWVLFRVRATTAPIRLHLGQARYARVGGAVLEPATRSRQDLVAAGTTFTAALAFPEADVGGTVELHLDVGGIAVPVNVGTAPYVPDDAAS